MPFPVREKLTCRAKLLSDPECRLANYTKAGQSPHISALLSGLQKIGQALRRRLFGDSGFRFENKANTASGRV